MSRAPATWLLFFPLAFLLSPAGVLAGELGINVYGLAHHFERGRARAIGADNEFNPGLGLRYRIPHDERIEFFLDGGAYRDSGRNTAVYAGGGLLWKFTPALGAGVALAAFDSDTYNRGRAFVAPLPVLSYRFGAASLNAVYMPRIRNFNDINTVGFWLTFWPRGW